MRCIYQFDDELLLRIGVYDNHTAFPNLQRRPALSAGRSEVMCMPRWSLPMLRTLSMSPYRAHARRPSKCVGVWISAPFLQTPALKLDAKKRTVVCWDKQYQGIRAPPDTGVWRRRLVVSVCVGDVSQGLTWVAGRVWQRGPSSGLVRPAAVGIDVSMPRGAWHEAQRTTLVELPVAEHLLRGVTVDRCGCWWR